MKYALVGTLAILMAVLAGVAVYAQAQTETQLAEPVAQPADEQESAAEADAASEPEDAFDREDADEPDLRIEIPDLSWIGPLIQDAVTSSLAAIESTEIALDFDRDHYDKEMSELDEETREALDDALENLDERIEEAIESAFESMDDADAGNDDSERIVHRIKIDAKLDKLFEALKDLDIDIDIDPIVETDVKHGE